MEPKTDEITSEYVVIYHDKRGLYENVLVIVSDENEVLLSKRSCIRFPNDVVSGLYGYDDGWWEIEMVRRLEYIPRMSYTQK